MSADVRYGPPGLESFVDEVLRLHEALKDRRDYGYIDCQWPPEHQEGIDWEFFTAIEQLKTARNERLAIDAKTLEEAREYRKLMERMWDQVLRRGVSDNQARVTDSSENAT